MSIKSFLSAHLSSFVLDEQRLQRQRRRAERRRQRAGEPHRVEFFHQVDDPYSHLLARGLLELSQRNQVVVAVWLVQPPDDWAAPERSRLDAYALRDAQRLGERAGFPFDGEHGKALRPPSPPRVASVQRQLVSTLPSLEQPGSQATLRLGVELGAVLWRAGDRGETDANLEHPAQGTSLDEAVVTALLAGTARRDALGHYLGGTCFYAGEWIWGLDRLHYLEARLRALGAGRESNSISVEPGSARHKEAVRASEGEQQVKRLIYEPPRLLQEPLDREASAALAGAGRPALPALHFFLSLRSPYTAIVVRRVRRLAEAFAVDLRLRFVLPMVMRGLPVQRSKRFYILRDAAREARRLGVAFGPVADPVGQPVERGYSLLPWAIEQGRGADYVEQFLTLVWSQAVDAGSDRGLRRIVEAAGLDWEAGRAHLEDPSWRATAEANRRELLGRGLWGVPSFRVGDVAVWGQDRLWVLEEEYRRLLASPSAPAVGSAAAAGSGRRARSLDQA